MLIITTIYIAEAEDPTQTKIHEPAWHEAAELKEATRQWVSIYEGKNRVLPIDID
ncbi:MAG: hypothetical protein RB191_03745 [Terriglobia bacterium]|nr:hypothetical protein [Terriglobia bacterium]